MGYEGYGERIRSIRHAKGLTLDAVAKRCGHSPQWLSNIEVRRNRGNVEDVREIAKALGVDPGALFCDNPGYNKEHPNVKEPLRNLLRDVQAKLRGASKIAASGLELSAYERIASAAFHVGAALSELEVDDETRD